MRAPSRRLLVMTLCSCALPAMLGNTTVHGQDRPAADEAVRKADQRKPVKLPAMVIDFQQKCIDIEAKVCLDDGFLELIACTRNTKEHESIVAVNARPMHIHTGLLLLGAKNGNPALRKRVGGMGPDGADPRDKDPRDKGPRDKDPGEQSDSPRWIDVPPRGDPVEVFLVFSDAAGKMVEHPIGEFVKRADLADQAGEKATTSRLPAFPETFVFAGSGLRDVGRGPRQYLAAQSGNVISIVTFGDELLCLEGIQSRENGALQWRVNSEKLPKVGSPVTLRLRPRK